MEVAESKRLISSIPRIIINNHSLESAALDP